MFYTSTAVLDRIYRFIRVIWIYFLHSYIIFCHLFFSRQCDAQRTFSLFIKFKFVKFFFSFSICYESMNIDKVILDSVWINLLFILFVLDSNRLIVSRFTFFSNENYQCIYEFRTIESKSRNELFCFSIIFLILL